MPDTGKSLMACQVGFAVRLERIDTDGAQYSWINKLTNDPWMLMEYDSEDGVIKV